MISAPPGMRVIVAGFGYAWHMSTLRLHPDAVRGSAGTVWDALWVRYALTLGNAALLPGLDFTAVIPLLLLIALIDTFTYPVCTHNILKASGIGWRFPLFITAMTWVDNLGILLMMLVQIFILFTGSLSILLLAAVALWMLWAKYSVATRCLGGMRIPGAGMVVLYMTVNALYAVLFDKFIHPIFPSFESVPGVS